MWGYFSSAISLVWECILKVFSMFFGLFHDGKSFTLLGMIFTAYTIIFIIDSVFKELKKND